VLFASSDGVLAGVGEFTFGYAKGLSYLSADPRACVNCHIMNEQYDALQDCSWDDSVESPVNLPDVLTRMDGNAYGELIGDDGGGVRVHVPAGLSRRVPEGPAVPDPDRLPAAEDGRGRSQVTTPPNVRSGEEE